MLGSGAFISNITFALLTIWSSKRSCAPSIPDPDPIRKSPGTDVAPTKARPVKRRLFSLRVPAVTVVIPE